MTSYAGRHADLYDLFYADKPYQAEAEFVDACLKKFSVGPTHKLLELACGTGTHAFQLEALGYDIVATDYSEDMLKRASLKSAERDSKVRFKVQDMSQLKPAEENFDAVICLFDSIGYVATNEALDRVFRGVNEVLRPGGLFVFEFWHAAAMLRNYDPLRVRRWESENGTVLRISETTLDFPRQLSTVTYSVYEMNNDLTYSTLSESQVNRYFLLQEMDARLTHSHFKPLKWFAGFSESETITDDTWHIVAVAQKEVSESKAR